MKHFLCLILCLVLLCACCVTAFAESEVEVVDEDYYTKFQGQDISISVYNWGEYISDGSDGLLDVNAAFEELTGIRVLYTTFATNEELYAKLKSGGTSYDIIIPSDYMVEILMFSNSRDSFAIALKRLGYSMNSTSEEELRDACESLKDQKMLVQAYVMDEIFDKMEGEEAMIAPYYAGDAITMADENPNLAFSIPDEGTNRFIDSICIPFNAKQKEAAEMYINFLCEPEVAAQNIEFIGYSTPNLAAYELLDEDMQQNEIAYPRQEVLSNTEAFVFLPAETSTLMDKLWTEVLSNDENYSKWTIPAFLLVGILFSIGINVRRMLLKKKENMM